MPMTDGEVQIFKTNYILLMNWKQIRILVKFHHSTCEGGRPLALGRTTGTLDPGKLSITL